MLLSDLLAYVIAGLLLIQAGLRAKSALKGLKRDRSLWGVFAALAAAWLTRSTAGQAVLNTHGIPDLSYFVKHALSIVGICALLRYVTSVYSTAHPDSDLPPAARLSARVHRVVTRAAVFTVLVMAGVFFFLLGEPRTSSPYLMERYQGEAALAVYMGLFYLYLGAAAVVCAIQWGGAVQQAPFRSLRIGLRMMATAMTIAVAYSLLRTGYLLVITVSPVSPAANRLQEVVTDTLLYVCFLLWGAGAIAPGTYAARERLYALRSLLDVHPMWRALALRFPDTVRHRPSTVFTRISTRAAPLDGVLDLFLAHGASLPARLGRYSMDIRDVIDELRRYVPHDLAERAITRAETELQPEFATEVQAEALWIHAALTVTDRSPERNALSAAYPFDPGSGPREEIAHLRAVASAFRLTSPAGGRKLLADAPADRP